MANGAEKISQDLVVKASKWQERELELCIADPGVKPIIIFFF